ncbi:8-amino-7-oxononanoate synthase [Carboxydocella sporoproducens DSM 16521]|uniref:8-amino-7-ketopelargonate synthase n=2 Tax=Carboxydocella TaxID=178898 RepID=A0A1T4S743_9FIRM|nr:MULTISPECIES: 8-amino-7-oxononanoate synthase [Carboxydocella]AVX20686.1 8-amino-7-oxononanoate synthase [Carboxydocella thermautotrophica]AVX31105.1 8-amino-7-oxononanoate synthase [Carboxydocella thermautotrophica]SKA24055.1 8-amino-7-oxononanoate synthase [Carboxydocella sporoproducens DSM 16521]
MEWIEQELALLRERELYREIKPLYSAAQPHVQTADGEKLLFCSNNYLGLTTEEKVVNACQEAVRQYGTGTGGSRLLYGANALQGQLEQALAELKKQENALLFGTGYMANIGIISTMVGKEDLIISDELNHASIIDGCRLSKAKVVIYKHNDYKHLEQLLKENYKLYRRILVVTDGVFSMDGDLAPLPEIVKSCQRYGAMLMVDDAHGTGVLGPDGSGTVAEYSLSPEEVLLHMGTLSKALAAEGGFVATRNIVKEYLINKCRSFIFSTALPPAVVGAALQAVKLIKVEAWRRNRLRYLAIEVRAQIRKLGYDVPDGITPIIPIIIGSSAKTMQLARELFKRGIIAPGVRPPTVPDGSSRLRVTLMATHSDSDIEMLLQALYESGKQIGVI